MADNGNAVAIPSFVDVSAESGIDFHHISGDEDEKRLLIEAKAAGIGAFDFDGDGWMDIFLAQGSTMERMTKGQSPHGMLLRNQGDWTFVDVTERAGITHRGWGIGVSAADVNNDGFVDLYLTYAGPNALYLNNGDGSFRNEAAKLGVTEPLLSSSAAFADYDADGMLDLFVANYIDMDSETLADSQRRCAYLGRSVMCGPNGLEGAKDTLYHQNSDGSFTAIGVETDIIDPEKRYGLGCVWGDIDNDGDQDLYVANDGQANTLLVNQGGGSFVEKGLASGLSLNADGKPQSGMGIDLADYDNDGLLDAYSTHWVSDYSTLYHNLGESSFFDVTAEAQIATPEYLFVSWGTGFFDLNHDGWKDIFHANGHTYPFLDRPASDLNKGLRRRAKQGPAKWKNRGTETYSQLHSLYLNLGDGSFLDAAAKAGPGLKVRSVGRGVAFADFDNDGDIDIAIANLNGSPLLLRNDQTSANRWISFRTRGRSSNRDGIGTRISVFTGDQRQIWEIKRTVGIYSCSDPRAHFGLSASQKVDRIHVRWPSGTVQEFHDIQSNRHYLLDEKEGLSEDPRLSNDEEVQPSMQLSTEVPPLLEKTPQ